MKLIITFLALSDSLVAGNELYTPRSTALTNSVSLFTAYANSNICIKVDSKKTTVLSNCKGFECWHSQLISENKQELTKIYNDFRERIALGTCVKCEHQYSNIFRMTWNWELEAAAITIASSHCPDKIKSTYINDSSIKFTTLMQCEVATTVFPLPSAAQTDMLDALPNLLENNKLLDFDKTNKFLRSGYSEFACAYIGAKTFDNKNIRYEANGHLVCFYCGPPNIMHDLVEGSSTDPSGCPSYAVKKAESNLCISKYLPTDSFPCEINPTCLLKRVPPIWESVLSRNLERPLISENREKKSSQDLLIITMSGIFIIILCVLVFLFIYIVYKEYIPSLN